ncbi:hypothetical protein [Microbacterium amylolyticum]|uniref:hypothetical protein n=1 Tax=Microbacterium amylolyticum TaxID=936337 RepID=UPI003159A713
MDVVVSPSVLTLAAGESADIQITLTAGSAPAEQWATGFLTWSGGTNDVRSPVAAFPVTADAPAEVSFTGVSGTGDVTIVSGISGDMPLRVAGRAAEQTVASGTQDSIRHTYTEVTIEEGTKRARFDLLTDDEQGSDSAGEGELTAQPNPLTVSQGAEATYEVSWSGLTPETTYYGVVSYADSDVATIVKVIASE